MKMFSQKIKICSKKVLLTFPFIYGIIWQSEYLPLFLIYNFGKVTFGNIMEMLHLNVL